MSDSHGSNGSPVRLYLDRDVTTRLAKDLRARGHDCMTTQETNNDTASDEEQLDFASSQSRCILTFNIGDFATLHKQRQAAGHSHSGIVVSRQLSGRQYGLLLARTLTFLSRFSAEQMVGNFVHLEAFKS